LSQAIVAWGFSFAPPEEVYENNKKYLKSEFEKVIKEIYEDKSQLPKELVELVKSITDDLKKLADEFLEGYTWDIFNSPNHKNWVEENVNKFNSIALEAKQILKELELEFINSEFSDHVVKFYLKYTDDIFKNFKDTLKKYLKKQEEDNLQAAKTVEANQLQESSKILNEIDILNKKLKALEKEKAENLKHLVDEAKTTQDLERLKLIAEEIKFTYAKAKKEKITTGIYREEIKKLLERILNEDLGEDLYEEGENILKKLKISEKEYKGFVKKVMNRGLERINKKPISGLEIIDKLRELGYSIVSDEEEIEKAIKEGKVVEIRTPYGEDYVIKVKVQNGLLTTKFVKILTEERQLSQYEKEKDVYVAKKWCEDFDKLVEKLRKNNIKIDIKARKDPEKEINYEVRKVIKRGERGKTYGTPREKRKST